MSGRAVKRRSNSLSPRCDGNHKRIAIDLDRSTASSLTDPTIRGEYSTVVDSVQHGIQSDKEVENQMSTNGIDDSERFCEDSQTSHSDNRTSCNSRGYVSQKGPSKDSADLQVGQPRGEDKLPWESYFRGDVFQHNAVSVRGNDGLLHYGSVVARENDCFIVKFDIKDDFKRIPLGSIYRVSRDTFLTGEYDSWESYNAIKDVEVLLRLKPDEPWKWYPATLIVHGRSNVYYPRHSLIKRVLPDSSEISALLPGHQVRVLSTERELEDLLIQSMDEVPCLPHYPFPWDRMNINEVLPRQLLSEILSNLDGTMRHEMLQVCRVWEDLLTTCCGVLLHFRGLTQLPSELIACRMLHQSWTDKTKVIALSGCHVVGKDAWIGRIMQSMVSDCGFTRVDTLILRNCRYARIADGYREGAMSSCLRNALSVFGTVCQRLILRNSSFRFQYVGRLSRTFVAVERTLENAEIDTSRVDWKSLFWSLFNTEEVIATVRWHFADHNPYCACVSKIIEVHNTLQSPDPESTPAYRGKVWTARDLVDLEPRELTGLTLLVIHAVLDKLRLLIPEERRADKRARSSSKKVIVSLNAQSGIGMENVQLLSSGGKFVTDLTCIPQPLLPDGEVTERSSMVSIPDPSVPLTQSDVGMVGSSLVDHRSLSAGQDQTTEFRESCGRRAAFATVEVKKPWQASFRGRVRQWNAVSVRGADGLLHYGLVVGGKEGDSIIVDFSCGKRVYQSVPLGRVYRLICEEISTRAFREKQEVEVLLRMGPEEPWKWYAATLVAFDICFWDFWLVKLNMPGGSVISIVLPRKQIRALSTETELEELLIQSLDEVPIPPHYPLPWDQANINKVIPGLLLAEIVGSLDVVSQSRVRRVCRLWNHIIATHCGEMVYLYNTLWEDELVWMLHHSWTRKTKVVALSGCSGLGAYSKIVGIMKSMITECGFDRLSLLVLRDCHPLVREIQFGTCHEAISELEAALGLFAPICQRLLLRNSTYYLQFSGEQLPSVFVCLKAERICINPASAELASSFLDLFKIQDKKILASWRRHFSPHDQDCECFPQVLEVLNTLQSPDPQGVPEYRGKQWKASDLGSLDPRKLNGLSRHVLRKILY